MPSEGVHPIGVEKWVNHFGAIIAADFRKRRLEPHTRWHFDEIYLKIGGRLVAHDTVSDGGIF
jgi:transposase-like protein